MHKIIIRMIFFFQKKKKLLKNNMWHTYYFLPYLKFSDLLPETQIFLFGLIKIHQVYY